ncbi:targeting protein for Xklp2 isoform X2 [Brachypodium distachyon]|uniref:TPX2 C-terminal domain-containing protein n=1 Tax=Brachypodium distachyon TaxID=15368 RepID=A0A2K2CKA7_BRADI|nr:targeting protein for Xklp2 isoform X2 [Brachypodium distachyon]PNT62464.1 hypothetical protein BRADI_4g03742v3 [Brachypodium distachyon]|eukprot:XP_014758059.1 targeting protein for Xklp2 isoform X2 [Brachypodium distachyon]
MATPTPTPTPAARRPRVRRPFAAVASLSAARNRMLLPASAENVLEVSDEMSSSSSCIRRSKKVAGEAAGKQATAFAVGGKAVAVVRKGKKKCSCSTPASKRPAPRTPSGRGKVSAAPAMAMAMAEYEPPRAPLWDFSEEKKVRARLSSPCDGGGAEEEESMASGKKRATWGATLEEAMAGLPEPGEGRVRYLVDTFERLLSLSRSSGGEPRSRVRARRKNNNKEAAASADEMDMTSYPSVAASSSSEVSSSIVDLPRRNRSSSRRSSGRDERRLKRCKSIDSSERSWSRKVTSQHPFNLRTEQRGKVKEDNFVEMMRMLLLEEERLRNPLAQGLPLTTDEPENLMKPPAKEPTEPFDVVLHSAVRAVGRARFDHQITERNIFLEKLELEKERQQKMDEEVEIKQLRKEQVPKAHPMPDFSKPFLPKRSVKPQTVPREPRFHTRSTTSTRHNPKT